VLALFSNGERVSNVMEGDQVDVVLSVTPFYGERGGQVGDAGEITTTAAAVEITGAIVTPHDQIVHSGRVSKGAISEGETVVVSVEPDYRGAVCRNHTATHLLHFALRQVLGEHVKQAGSMVSSDRLRFDFTHLSALSRSQLAEVERLVNLKILENQNVAIKETSLDEAKAMGATALFDEKYSESVRVVSINDYSMELCGGTHVEGTGEIGVFKIISEAGIGAGMRRIEALTGFGAYNYLNERNESLEKAAQQLKTSAELLPEKLVEVVREMKELQRENQRLQLKMAAMEVDSLLDKVSAESGVSVLSARVSAGNMETMREMADRLKNKLGSGVIVLGAAAEGKVLLVATVTPDLIKAGYHAGKLISEVAGMTGGGGGGRPDMAQAGGKNVDDLDDALAQVNNFVRGQVEKRI
jgi:alanyl-tRNA synthetase